MLATLVSEPFDDKDWVYETKWDGFRLIHREAQQYCEALVSQRH